PLPPGNTRLPPAPPPPGGPLPGLPLNDLQSTAEPVPAPTTPPDRWLAAASRPETLLWVCETRTSGRDPVTVTEPTVTVSPTMMHAAGWAADQLAGCAARHSELLSVSSVVDSWTCPLAAIGRHTCPPVGP